MLIEELAQKSKTVLKVIRNPKDNLRLLFPNTDRGIQSFNNIVSVLNRRSIRKRKLVIKNLIDYEKYRDFSNDGFRHINGSEIKLIKKLVSCLKKIKINNLKSKKNFLVTNPILPSTKEFNLIKQIILDKNFLKPLVNYFGQVPILKYVSVWHSPNNSYEVGRSQDFHLDCEDIRQLKVFIALDPITSESGPMNLVAADISEKVRASLKVKLPNYLNSNKLNDSDIFDNVRKNDVKTLLAKKGDVLMVDTSRCYHCGSRPGNKPRNLLALQFLSLSSNEIPIRFYKEQFDNIEEMIFNYFETSKI